MRRAATTVLLAVVLLAGCTGTPAPPSTPPPTFPAAPPTTGSAAAGQVQALPVYYVASTPAGLRLQREFHRVPTVDPGSDAVREMLASPIGTDPDYRSHWPAGTELRSPVTVAGGVITVDLSGVGGAQVGTELAEMTVQQLVFTVQGALRSTDPVRILRDGAPVEQLWGAVRTAEPVARGDVYALRSLVQIDTPAHGATVGRDVVVSGEAAAFEANVPWEVLRDGAVVRSGFTTSAEGQRFAKYEFSVRLDPGTYTVRVLEDDPSDGEGRPALTDDKTITVAP